MLKKLETLLDETVLRGHRPYFWLAGIAFALYFQTIFFSFTYLDDHVLILERLYFLRDMGNIFKTFTLQVFFNPLSAFYYRPMLIVSFMIDTLFGGGAAWAYHFSNILLHAAATTLVFLMLKMFGYRKQIAFPLSLLFAIHPVLSQAVAWIPGRNDSLLAVFILASIIFGLSFLNKPTIRNLMAHAGCFALALFTKESALVLLPLISIYAAIKRSQVLKAVKQEGLKFYFLGLSWILILMMWFLLRSIALVNSTGYSLDAVMKTIISNSPAIFLYLGKFFYPANLSVLPTIQDSPLLAGYVAAALLLVVFVYTLGKRRYLALFGAAWFLAFLLPAFVRPNIEYQADFLEHRLYVPMIGVLLIMAEFLQQIRWRRYLLPALMIIFPLLAAVNLNHSRVFQNRMSFWLNAVENSPSHPLAYKNLGSIYYLDGKLDLAEASYLQALKLNPTESMVYNNLGMIFEKRGELKKAEEAYLTELEHNPYYENTLINYGSLLYKNGDKKEEAARMWLDALSVNPDSAAAYRNLAIYYLELGEEEKSNRYVLEAQRRGLDLQNL